MATTTNRSSVVLSPVHSPTAIDTLCSPSSPSSCHNSFVTTPHALVASVAPPCSSSPTPVTTSRPIPSSTTTMTATIATMTASPRSSAPISTHLLHTAGPVSSSATPTTTSANKTSPSTQTIVSASSTTADAPTNNTFRFSVGTMPSLSLISRIGNRKQHEQRPRSTTLKPTLFSCASPTSASNSVSAPSVSGESTAETTDTQPTNDVSPLNSHPGKESKRKSWFGFLTRRSVDNLKLSSTSNKDLHPEIISANDVREEVKQDDASPQKHVPFRRHRRSFSVGDAFDIPASQQHLHQQHQPQQDEDVNNNSLKITSTGDQFVPLDFKQMLDFKIPLTPIIGSPFCAASLKHSSTVVDHADNNSESKSINDSNSDDTLQNTSSEPSENGDPLLADANLVLQLGDILEQFEDEKELEAAGFVRRDGKLLRPSGPIRPGNSRGTNRINALTATTVTTTEKVNSTNDATKESPSISKVDKTKEFKSFIDALRSELPKPEKTKEELQLEAAEQRHLEEQRLEEQREQRKAEVKEAFLRERHADLQQLLGVRRAATPQQPIRIPQKVSHVRSSSIGQLNSTSGPFIFPTQIPKTSAAGYYRHENRKRQSDFMNSVMHPNVSENKRGSSGPAVATRIGSQTSLELPITAMPISSKTSKSAPILQSLASATEDDSSDDALPLCMSSNPSFIASRAGLGPSPKLVPPPLHFPQRPTSTSPVPIGNVTALQIKKTKPKHVRHLSATATVNLDGNGDYQLNKSTSMGQLQTSTFVQKQHGTNGRGSVPYSVSHSSGSGEYGKIPQQQQQHQQQQHRIGASHDQVYRMMPSMGTMGCTTYASGTPMHIPQSGPTPAAPIAPRYTSMQQPMMVGIAPNNNGMAVHGTLSAPAVYGSTPSGMPMQMTPMMITMPMPFPAPHMMMGVMDPNQQLQQQQALQQKQQQQQQMRLQQQQQWYGYH